MNTNTLSNRRKNELRTVQLQLIKFMQCADCWHDISLAANAMFHARLIWEPFNRECCSLETENESIHGRQSVEG